MQYNFLGPDDAYIKFHKIDIEPMPFNILRKIRVEADVETLTKVGNNVSLSVTLEKSNLGNRFKWKVRHLCVCVAIIYFVATYQTQNLSDHLCGHNPKAQHVWSPTHNLGGIT